MDFGLIKVGNVLHFADRHPIDIVPPRQNSDYYKKSRPFPPGDTHLGRVRVISHPDIPRQHGRGPTLRQLANHVGSRFSRYSKNYKFPSKFVAPKNITVGHFHADFVGYTNGTTQCVRSDRVVFSKDFSGCLMVVYTLIGARYVAHAPASEFPQQDCKKAFLEEIADASHKQLIGWFRPWIRAHSDATICLKRLYFDRDPPVVDKYDPVTGQHLGMFPTQDTPIGPHFIRSTDQAQCPEYTVFGVVDTHNNCYAIEGFRPDGYTNYFMILSIRKDTINRSPTFH